MPYTVKTNQTQEEKFVESDQLKEHSMNDNVDNSKYMKETAQEPTQQQESYETAHPASEAQQYDEQVENESVDCSLTIPEASEEPFPIQENVATTSSNTSSAAAKQIVIRTSPMNKVHLTMRISKSPSVSITETFDDKFHNATSSSTTTFVESSQMTSTNPSTAKVENVARTQNAGISFSSTNAREKTVEDATNSTPTDSKAYLNTTNRKLNTVHYIALDKSGHPYCKPCGQVGGFTPIDYAANNALVPPATPKIYLVNCDVKMIKKTRVVAATDKDNANPRKKRKLGDDKKKERRRAKRRSHHGSGNIIR